MIRKIQPADYAACAVLYAAAFAEKPWKEQWSQEQALLRVKELMNTPVSVGYLSEEDGRISGMLIGHAFSYLFGRELFIHELCVSPDFQRQGVGSRLLAHVCGQLKAEGFVGMCLNTRCGYPSEQFYLHNGFRQDERNINLYRVL